MIRNLIWRMKQASCALRSAPKYTFDRECPICGYTGVFDPFGFPVRPEAQCPKCKSLERHRQISLWLDSNHAVIAGKRVLHFAPEAALTALLKPYAASYVSADIVPGRADLTLDIEHMALDDGSFDVVVCSHVLEHVDDAKALGEIGRILAPGGVAMLLVPLVHHWPHSFERPAPTERERIKYFGQFDHIRRYGADFPERVRAAGFAVTPDNPSPESCVQYGLGLGSVMYLARPAS